MVGVLLCIKTLFLIVDKVNKWIKQFTLLKTYTHTKITMIKKMSVHLHFPKGQRHTKLISHYDIIYYLWLLDFLITWLIHFLFCGWWWWLRWFSFHLCELPWKFRWKQHFLDEQMSNTFLVSSVPFQFYYALNFNHHKNWLLFWFRNEKQKIWFYDEIKVCVCVCSFY